MEKGELEISRASIRNNHKGIVVNGPGQMRWPCDTVLIDGEVFKDAVDEDKEGRFELEEAKILGPGKMSLKTV